MNVLKLGDKLCFCLEAPNEIRLVGVLGQDDLDRYVPVDELLAGAVDSPIGALADAIE